MKKLMVAVVALGVTLGAWADDSTYVLESGQSDTQAADTETDVRYSSILVNGDLTIGGKMWMRGPSGSPGTLTMTGGTIAVSSSTAGLGYSHGGSTRAEGVLDATFEPDDNGVFPKVTIVNGATGSFKTSGTEHWNFGVRNLYVGKDHTTATSEDGSIDLFDLQNNGSLAFYHAYNYTSLTGRVSVAGKCSLSKGSNYNEAGVFTKGAWLVDMTEGSSFTIGVGNQRGWLNSVGASVGFEGAGNVTLSQLVGGNLPCKINSGAKFNQTGKVIFTRSSGDPATAYYQINDGSVFGAGITTVSAGNTNIKVEIPSDVDLKVPNVAFTSVGCGFFGAGTLSIDATEQDRTFSAEIPNTIGSPVKKTETPNEITIVKLGEKDLTISASTNFISLKLNGGTTHVKNSTRIQSLVCDGGTFVPDDGVTVVVEEGLSTLTGKLVGPDGGDWPRGEHLICYYRGEDPTGLSAEVRFGDKATFAVEEVTEGEYAGYKALMLTVEYTGKTIHLTENDAEIDLCELMGGSLSVPCDVIIDAGVTNYNTTALTGIYPLTVTGGGVLVLNASSPDYTGEVYIENASVRVTADRPFGTNRVTVRGSTDAGGTSCIYFANTDPITLPNEIFIASYGACFASVSGAKKVSFLKTVTAPEGFTFADAHATKNTVDIYWSFEKEVISASGKTIMMSGYAAAEFLGKVTVGTIFAQGGGSPTGIPKIHLYNSDNVIGCIKSRWQGTIFAEAENAWGGGYITDDTGYDMTFSLKAHDQTMKYINADIYTGTSMSTEAQIVADDPGATLTLTGTTSSQTTHRMRLNGGVSLVLDSANTGFVQTFKGGTSTTKGSITAKSGTLAFTDDIDKTGKQKLLSTNYVSLVNVPQLNVTGGAIRISPIRDGIFAGVTNLTVSAGSFVVEGPGQEPFGPLATTKAIASLSGSGTMAIADGLTVSLKRLKVDGEFVDAGRYTGEGGPASATVLPQLTGTGVLTVRKSGPGGMILVIK